jgi:hypothetical protein
VQFLADEDGELVIETVSNRFLDRSLRWTQRDESLLREIGFHDPEPAREPRPNWWWTSKGPGGVLRACRMAAATFASVFGVGGDVPMTLTRTVWRSRPAPRAADPTRRDR